MIAHRTPSPKHPDAPHGSVLSYSLGFAASILLTLGAFATLAIGGAIAPYLILTFAIAQILVQLFLFLHIGSRRTPAAYRSLLGFSLLIIAIIIGGTIWIMTNLQHLHMDMSQPALDTLYEYGDVAPQYELR